MHKRRQGPGERIGETTWVLGVLGVLTLCAATCGGTSRTSSDASGTAPKTTTEPARAQFQLFAFGRVLGTVGPCGCTTEPLGGLQYAFGYIEQAPANARMLIEPGSFLFPRPGGPLWPDDDAGWSQASDRATLLHKRFSAFGGHLVSGVGPTDVISPKGDAALGEFALPRVVANVTLPASAPETPGHRLVNLSDQGLNWRVAVTSVVDPKLPKLEKLGKVTEPVPALNREVAAMREAGASLTVVMAQGRRAFAERLARDVEGLDIVVVGIVDGVDRERLGTPFAKLGATYVIEPGDQLQTMTAIQLSVAPGLSAVPAASAWTVAPSKADQQQELARVEQRIAKFEADPNADRGFVAQLEAERDRLLKAMTGTVEGDVVAKFEQVKVTCKLPVDDAAKAALEDYKSAVAQANKERFTGVTAPAVPKGGAGYVGVEACADCHDEAVEFWKNTEHADAYATLVDDNTQYDVDCVGCHVTGFRQPGGSEVVENAGLVDVQCESCHGPGSLHVDDGGDDLKLIELHAPESLCATQCHTPEHSDTFEYQAYLRDILGPGHGEAARNKLGEGATGAELRAAGLAKAGGACKKM